MISFVEFKPPNSDDFHAAAHIKGATLITSDDHAGLKAARRATLPNVPWQRCQFHFQQNAQSYVNSIDNAEVGRCAHPLDLQCT